VDDRTCHICKKDFRYPSSLRQHFLSKTHIAKTKSNIAKTKSNIAILGNENEILPNTKSGNAILSHETMTPIRLLMDEN